MKQIKPTEELEEKPCSIVAMWTAYEQSNELKTSKEEFVLNLQDFETTLKDGYSSLRKCNEILRKHFNVEKYTYIKRNERETFEELADIAETINLHKAIICVENHFIYADFDQDKYWSFFNNFGDYVVAIWRLK